MRNIFLWIFNHNRIAYHSINGRHYRKLPVPRTRCFRPSVQYFRQPKTFQELKSIDAFYHDEDAEFYKVKFRNRRKHIPTAWDDNWIYRQRNWKKFRKHQWKDKK